MQTNKSKKILVMALIAMIMAMPMSLIAQSNGKTDGFFSSWDNDGGSRDDLNVNVDAEGGITNYGFGEGPAPLGGGLAILAVSAAGYALLKRRKNNNTKSPKHLKHLNLLLVLLMVSVLFTQCKKADVQTVQTGGNTVNITLSAGDGSKAVVDPDAENYPSVTFADDDTICVGYNGRYVGYLTYESDGEKFTGPLTMPKELPSQPQPLHFYFLGNKCLTKKLPTGTTQELTADISNQSGSWPVISYAPSNETYPSDGNKYSARLENKCALVKFTTAENYNDIGDLVIKGVNNKVTVTLSSNKFDPSGEDDNGSITMSKRDGEYWAILLPNDGNNFGADVEANGYTGYAHYESGITANDYISEGITVHEYVDLDDFGKWATCNVGASTPGEYGYYYSYDEYQEEFYRYNDEETLLHEIKNNWCDQWSMPLNLKSWEDLFDLCTWTRETYGYGVVYFKGIYKEKTIYLPAAGYLDRDGVNNYNGIGFYWVFDDDDDGTYSCMLITECDDGKLSYHIYDDVEDGFIDDIEDVSCSVRLIKQ